MNGFWGFGRVGFFAVFFDFAVSFSVEIAGQKLGVAWIGTPGAAESMRSAKP